MTAYYNEFDPYAAQWLRNLIAAGHIAPGEVDERSIRDVSPDDLRGFTQCHFFAGIGIWSYAARRAGWPDDRQIWTGSCPCQPFSAAGKRKGIEDDRHLWPEYFRLVAECGPDTVLGEQVASKDGLAWLEGVQADLERAGYAVGAVDTCAAGFADEQGNEGFHIRQRLYWGARRLAYADGAHGERGARQGPGPGEAPGARAHAGFAVAGASGSRGLGHSESDGRVGRQDDGDAGRRERPPGQAGADGGVADAYGEDSGRWGVRGPGESVGPSSRATRERPPGLRQDRASVDWLPCRDGKLRPVESGTFPLAHEDPARVGRLRAYGNALDAAQAQGFVKAWLDCDPG